MTTPNVHEITSARRYTGDEHAFHLADWDAERAADGNHYPLRHNYDPLTRDEIEAYRRRCAEIRALDRAADIARANAGAQS